MCTFLFLTWTSADPVNAQLSTNELREIVNKKLSGNWKEMPDAQRKTYLDRAAVEKERFEKEKQEQGEEEEEEEEEGKKECV